MYQYVDICFDNSGALDDILLMLQKSMSTDRLSLDRCVEA